MVNIDILKKKYFKIVEDLAIKNNGRVELSDWVMNNDICWAYRHFKDFIKENNFFKTDNGSYIVYEVKATDSTGFMDTGTPPLIIIEKVRGVFSLT